MNFWAPFWDQRGNFGSGSKSEKSEGTNTGTTTSTGTQTSRQRTKEHIAGTQQTMVQPKSAAEFQQMMAAMQSELFRMFLAQREATELQQAPLMTPMGREMEQALNQRFNDEQDERGFSGPASPILNARAMGMASLLAHLEQQRHAERLAAFQSLQASPGSLGLLGLGMQERIAGSPTFTSQDLASLIRGTGSQTGTQTASGSSFGNTSGSGSGQGFSMGSLGGLLGGIGNLYAGYGAYGAGGAAATGLPAVGMAV